MKVIKYTAATVIGLIAFILVFSLMSIIIRFLASIPFLRYIIYWPSDASWALIVLPSSASAFCAAWISDKISGTAKPAVVIILIFWIVNIIAIFARNNFTWREFLQSCVGIVTCFLCFNE